MSSRLDWIGDWEARAGKARYTAFRLAQDVGITRQQLNRYFQSKFGTTLHAWLKQQKLKDGIRMLQEGRLVKEVAHELGFNHATHFSRAFRRASGGSPMRMRLADFPPES